MKICELCGRTSENVAIHVHHVTGRVGPNKDLPENKMSLCVYCHHTWHNQKPDYMAEQIYKIMKSTYGERFPIEVNNHKYYPKWLLGAESRLK